MNEVVFIDIDSLRKSVYNPRLVQDPERHQILVESIKREGVKQPLLVYPAEDGKYEVLDGSRRLEAAKQAGAAKLPCIITAAEKIPQTSLSIHFSQEDLTPEELITFVERLIADEVFPSVEEVCRFLGVSKTWFYTLRKAAKLRPIAEKLSTTALALVEKTEIDENMKRQVVEALQVYPLPRNILQQALEEIEEKHPANPVEVIEKHYSMVPKKAGENIVTASGLYEYFLTKRFNVLEFSAKRGVETLWRVEVPLQDLPVVRMLWQKL